MPTLKEAVVESRRSFKEKQKSAQEDLQVFLKAREALKVLGDFMRHARAKDNALGEDIHNSDYAISDLNHLIEFKKSSYPEACRINRLQNQISNCRRDIKRVKRGYEPVIGFLDKYGQFMTQLEQLQSEFTRGANLAASPQAYRPRILRSLFDVEEMSDVNVLPGQVVGSANLVSLSGRSEEEKTKFEELVRQRIVNGNQIDSNIRDFVDSTKRHRR